MAFEVFQRQRSPLVSQPYITIQKRGTLSLNAAAFAALGSPQSVELLFDREDQRVGLRNVDGTVEHAYAVRPNGTKASSFLVGGTAFTQYYGIDTKTARRWPAEVVDDMLVIDLKQPGTEIISNRTRGMQRREAQLRA